MIRPTLSQQGTVDGALALIPESECPLERAVLQMIDVPTRNFCLDLDSCCQVQGASDGDPADIPCRAGARPLRAKCL